MDGETRIDTRPLADGTATLVVTVNGELDMRNAPEFDVKLLAAVEGSSGSVLVDLSGCDFIDSTTLRVLVKAHTASEGRISVIAPATPLRHVLEISLLDRVLNVYPDHASALDGHVRNRGGDGATSDESDRTTASSPANADVQERHHG